ncbi:MAG: hypothetical protein NWS74_01895 [Salibacteraceae bacterium]|nr:hypothetical protein [Salibacteraceae bacterium]MDP4843168.1 hypothetical protein [Salibacteraceae bacterium]
MKKQVNIWIYGLLILAFLSYKWFESRASLPPFFHSYFEDLLAMPIFLKTALILIQSFNDKWKKNIILKRDIIIITLLTGAYFELILPVFDHRFTNDPIDLLAYSLGSLFFAFFLNKPLNLKVRLNSNF